MSSEPTPFEMKTAMCCALVFVIIAACNPECYDGCNACATRGASYVGVWKEETGNCGPLPDETLSVSASGTMTGILPYGPLCAPGFSSSDYLCGTHIGCYTGGDGGPVTEFSGDLRWSGDGSKATGVVDYFFAKDDFSIPNLVSPPEGYDGGFCHACYSLVITRL